jgi:hypothetical protein
VARSMLDAGCFDGVSTSKRRMPQAKHRVKQTNLVLDFDDDDPRAFLWKELAAQLLLPTTAEPESDPEPQLTQEEIAAGITRPLW